MKSFKEFINEAHDISIQIDTKHLEGALNNINAELDAITERPFKNAPFFLSQLRACLERYGILIPAGATPTFLHLEGELVYLLGTSSHHLYIVFNTTENGLVDGYAQVVTDDELDDLMNMDHAELTGYEDHGIGCECTECHTKTWVPPARKDDDSGNSDEY